MTRWEGTYTAEMEYKRGKLDGIREENETCARIAESQCKKKPSWNDICGAIAAAIRARIKP